MNVVIKWSVILAALVAVLSVVIALTGLHQNPMVGGMVSIVIAIAINVVVVFLALKQTAAENFYGKQLLNGVLIGAVAGVLILLTSWLLLAVVFPDYLAQMAAGYEEWFEAAGMTEDQIDTQMQKLDNATALGQSIAGLIGTFFTSIIAAAIIAIFKRKK